MNAADASRERNWKKKIKQNFIKRKKIQTVTGLEPTTTYFVNEHSTIQPNCQFNQFGWLNGWVFVYKLIGCGFDSRCSHLNFRFRACFEQAVFDIQATFECEFTLRRVRDMIRTHNESRWKFKGSRRHQ